MALKLTRRQYQLIRCGALGMSDKQIATEMGVSPDTVKIYMCQLRDKIGRFDRLMLPGMALLLGLVSINDICRPALAMLQEFIPEDDSWTRADERESAD